MKRHKKRKKEWKQNERRKGEYQENKKRRMRERVGV